MHKLSALDKSHARLFNLLDFIKETFVYDESSPTCLKWKSDYRKGKGNSKVRRLNMTAGGISPDGERNIITVDKLPCSVSKVVWVMHNGEIPKGFTVFHKDGNYFNNKIENLYTRETKLSLDEKYSDKIKEFLKYDETSPSFLRWVKRSALGSSVNAGDVAGSLDITDGYWKLHALGSNYKVARLIYFLHFGKIPEGFYVDHIDRDRSNNNIKNLRLVPPAINGRNRTKNSNNSTGENGITYCEFFNKKGTLIRKYVMTLTYNGKKYCKSFSLEKYGDKLAWELSLQAKQLVVEELKVKGAGFTCDHGT